MSLGALGTSALPGWTKKRFGKGRTLVRLVKDGAHRTPEPCVLFRMSAERPAIN